MSWPNPKKTIIVTDNVAAQLERIGIDERLLRMCLTQAKTLAKDRFHSDFKKYTITIFFEEFSDRIVIQSGILSPKPRAGTK